MNYNKHRLHSPCKRTFGAGIFTEGAKTIGKRILKAIGSQLLSTAEKKAQDFVKNKFAQVLSKKPKDVVFNSKRDKIQEFYGTGLKKFLKDG